MSFSSWCRERYYRSLRPKYSKLLSSLESMNYRSEDKKWAKEEYEELKKNICDPYSLSKYYRDYHYWWQKDKYFDFISDPYITVLKRGGDCDDFAELSMRILKDKFTVARLSLHTKDSGHAVCAVKYLNGKYVVLSNIHCYGSYDSLKEAAFSYYGKDTIWWQKY